MNSNGNILIVDDDREICAVMQDYLSLEGFRVSIAHDGSEMRRVINQSPVDLIVMDLVLPKEDGLSLVRSVRAENSDVGILMLTARADTVDRIIGLEVGADDYLVKPLHLRELLARVRSVMRRKTQPAADVLPANLPEIRFAGWHIDRKARRLRSPNGENVSLTKAEFDLLVVFATNPNQVLSRDRLLDAEASPFDRTIDVRVGRLRRKLNDDPRKPRMIKTVRGGGYMFTATTEPGAALRGSPPGDRTLESVTVGEGQRRYENE
jgi:two-component system OmpR family response regulator